MPEPVATPGASAPEDYYEALTDLLPALLEQYGRDEIAAYMKKNNMLVLKVIKWNEALSDPARSQDKQGLILSELATATSDYYNYLAGIPEDVRRFILLMGGITLEEAELLQALYPMVSPELRQFAGVMPAFQAIRPKNYVMPIDPITNRLAQLKEFNQITVARQKNLAIQTAVTLDCPPHMKIDGDFHLTNYDKSIINGVISILESGSTSFTVPMLYHAMTGKENPTVDGGLLDEISAKLDTMRKLTIRIDLTEEIRAHMIKRQTGIYDGSVNHFSIEGYLLPLNKYIGVVNGKQSELYQIIDTPPLHSYARLKNQITTVSIDLLKAPLNNTATTIPLKTYLLGRIEAMKNDHNHMTRDKILFASIYKELGEQDADKKRKKRIRDFTAVILTHFVNMRYITRYEVIKEGRALTGVRISWRDKPVTEPATGGEQLTLAETPILPPRAG